MSESTPKVITDEMIAEQTQRIHGSLDRVAEGVAALRAERDGLLEALEAVVNYEASPDFSKWTSIIEKARNAIAKATGNE